MHIGFFCNSQSIKVTEPSQVVELTVYDMITGECLSDYKLTVINKFDSTTVDVKSSTIALELDSTCRHTIKLFKEGYPTVIYFWTNNIGDCKIIHFILAEFDTPHRKIKKAYNDWGGKQNSSNTYCNHCQLVYIYVHDDKFGTHIP